MRLVLAVLGVLVGGPALAQEAGGGEAAPTGDVAAGSKLAQDVCSACHRVEAGAGMVGQRLTLPWEEGVPLTFEDIANTEGVTGTALQVWLTNSHPNMPDFVMTEQEIRYVSAYILSLKHGGA